MTADDEAEYPTDRKRRRRSCKRCDPPPVQISLPCTDTGMQETKCYPKRVAFCEAVYDGTSSVEGVTCRRVTEPSQCEEVWSNGEIPLLIDETGESVQKIQPDAVIDAILAKKNLGTTRAMAPLTVGLGPGFTAGEDVDYVVETQRGHNLARVITEGPAAPNTGIPGIIAGYGKERVIHSPAAGVIHNLSQIADVVEKDEIIAMVGDTPVYASLTGVLKEIIREGYQVPKGMKIADIDPRKERRKTVIPYQTKPGVLQEVYWRFFYLKEYCPDEQC